MRFKLIACSLATVALLSAIDAPTSAQAPSCVPIPWLEQGIALVEPDGPVVADPRGTWIVFSILSSETDVANGLFKFEATATPDDPPSSQSQRLTVSAPYRLSGEPQTPGSKNALWLMHISNPRFASARVSVDYWVNLGRTPTGAECAWRMERHVGEYRWKTEREPAPR